MKIDFFVGLIGMEMERRWNKLYRTRKEKCFPHKTREMERNCLLMINKCNTRVILFLQYKKLKLLNNFILKMSF